MYYVKISLKEVEWNGGMKGKALLSIGFVCMMLFFGCSKAENNISTSKNKPADVTREANAEDKVYELEKIELTEKERNEAISNLTNVIELCQDIYNNQEAGHNTSEEEASADREISEEIVHQMVERAASDGTAVTCGEYDYNMQNYESVAAAVQKAKKGKIAETTFFEINTSGNFIYNHLQFKKKKLYLTTATAYLDENQEITLQELEKIKVYDWKYTKRGWLIWEKTKSKNQEMDMHVLYRVEPLSDMCRQMTNTYITPISYFCNNLFLTDWDEESMELLEFNDLYDFLYQMKYGRKLDEEAYEDGIPKAQFEEVVQTYFDISTERLEQYARYDAEKETYPWEAIGPWNRVQQFQPFPEIVDVKDNGDGTWTFMVDAVFKEAGTDKSFGHEVRMRQDPDGSWKYVGNVINRKGEYRIPQYRARRKY